MVSKIPKDKLLINEQCVKRFPYMDIIIPTYRTL